MNHVDVRYTGYGADGAIVVNGGELTLTNSVLRECSTNGVRILQSNPVLTDNTYHDNSGSAVSMDRGSDPAITGVTVEGNGWNGLTVDSGTLPGDSHWNDPDIVYRVTICHSNGIVVPEGVTLTIAPGQIVKHLDSYSTLDIRGTLVADGTVEAPIVFTSVRDDSVGGDTNNDGDASAPNRGQWSRIQFSDTSTGNVMDHVQVMYTGYGSDAGVIVNGAPLTLTNSVIAESNTNGLRVLNSNPVVTNNTFRNNRNSAVSMNVASDPNITGVTVENNGWNGLSLDAGTLPGDGRWDDLDIVYRVTTYSSNGVVVPEGVTLTIAPGQIIKHVNAYSTIDVRGTLMADGTAEAPIVFTSVRDDSVGGDTNNDGETSAPSRGNWSRIEFADTSTGNVMDHVQVMYAGYGSDAGVIMNGASLTLTNSVIAESYTNGLRVLNSNPVVTNNTFRNNRSSAISMNLASDPNVTGVTVENNGWNGLSVDAGALSGDSYWDDPDIVYRVTTYHSCGVIVPEGATLRIAPGQVIKHVDSYSTLDIRGTLVADGTEEAPIVFTSVRDDSVGGDTNNDGETSAPSRGNWSRIEFAGTSTGNVLDHVEVRYAGYGSAAAVQVNGGELTLTNSTLMETYGDGMRVLSSDPVLTNNTFRNNSNSAISMNLASQPQVNGVTLENNGTNGLRLDSGTLLGDSSWDQAELVHVLSDDVTVPFNSTLSIAPGVVVKAYHNTRYGYRTDIFVEGTLKSLSAAEAPVVFTSWLDDSAGGDTNNDGDATSPAARDWGKLQFSADSHANEVEHAEFHFGDGIRVEGGDLSLVASVVNGSGSITGVDNAQLELHSNLLINNYTAISAATGALINAVNNTIDGSFRAVSVSGETTRVRLTNNSITNSTRNGVYVSNEGQVIATSNNVIGDDVNYAGILDPTGTDGNISADPLYVDREAGDFHLQSGSPAIDAATSLEAPVNDHEFRWRYDDPATTDTGAGPLSYYDIGAFEFGGMPRAVKHRPVGDVEGLVGEVVFTFRGAMDTNSFAIADDVVSFTGPSGPITVDDFRWLNPYQLELTFATQALIGDYEFVLGTNILDDEGQAIDQDGDGNRGEVEEDEYVAIWTITPPRVVSHSPDDYTAAPLDRMSFTFDRPMDQTSFTIADDIASFTDPAGNAIEPTSFNWTDGRTLELLFPPQSTLGFYEVILGPDIRDIGGNLIDQDRDGVFLESPGD